jgi:hypothetical protein
VKRYASVKGAMAWGNYTVFPPSQPEVGCPLYYRQSDGYYWPPDDDDSAQLQRRFPIYNVRPFQKKYNNLYDWYWTSSPLSSQASDSSGSAFCGIYIMGLSKNQNAACPGKKVSNASMHPFFPISPICVVS